MSEDTTQKKSTKSKPALGVGVDIGTMNLVSARKVGRQVKTKRHRDCFLDLEPDVKKMLKLSDVSYVEQEDRILILGDAAIQTANLFGKEVRRPLSQGLIAPGEVDALEVLSIMVESVVGPPQEEGEVCYFSVPAAPIDNPEQDVVYHTAVFEQILSELGYDPIPGNEALAIIYAECADTTFSGIGISFGSGMTNVALAYKTMSAEELEFSVGRGGDWIDAGAAKAIGSTSSKMCMIKESGLNLMDASEGDPKYKREREALITYYKSLITYAIQNIAKKFKDAKNSVDLQEPIPIVISGGTSKPKGFLELFIQIFNRKRKRFPIDILDIRLVDDPMTSVAQGLLVQAMQEYVE